MHGLGDDPCDVTNQQRRIGRKVERRDRKVKGKQMNTQQQHKQEIGSDFDPDLPGKVGKSNVRRWLRFQT